MGRSNHEEAVTKIPRACSNCRTNLETTKTSSVPKASRVFTEDASRPYFWPVPTTLGPSVPRLLCALEDNDFLDRHSNVYLGNNFVVRDDVGETQQYVLELPVRVHDA